MLRLRLIISGQVQGVGYRWFAQKHAESSGLTGFARNLADGSVEIEVQGEELAIEEFVEKLRVGPRSAQVSQIERNVAKLQVGETGFLAY